MSFRKKDWGGLLFLGILVVSVYFNSLGNNFVSDDLTSIVANPSLSRPELFLRSPYFVISPVLVLYYLINQVFGLNPLFYRLINIFAHAGAVFLIYTILRHLNTFAVALFVATVFAIHPLMTESVAWISGIPYSLGGFFVLTAFFFYLRGRNYKSLFFFYLALCTSEKIIIFPLVLFLYEIAFGKLKDSWSKLPPFFLLSFFWTIFLFSQIGQRVSSLQTSFGGAPERLNPLIQIPIAVTSYLQLIFWPAGLTLYHSEMFFSQTEYFLRLGVFILFLLVIFVSFFKNRRVFFWLSFFLITLLPTLTPLGISWIVAERYVYLGTIGIIVATVLAIKKMAVAAKSKTLFWGALATIVVLLSIRTIVRNADWESHDTLWLATAKTSPSSPQNHNNLGDYYGRHGDLKRSAEEFQIAIKLNPQYADAYHNLGSAYRDMGNLDLAIENYQKALTFNPTLWQSYYNLAAIYYYQKKYAAADEFLSKAKKLNPEIKPFTKKL